MNVPTNLNNWFNHTKIRRDPLTTGMRISSHGMILGESAGPAHGLEFLLHEMAHFIEIDDARCLEIAWGLRCPKIYIGGRICREPRTFQLTEREIRVSAIQAVLARHLSIPFDIESQAESLEGFMPDSVHAFAYYNILSISNYRDRVVMAREHIQSDIEEKASKLNIQHLFGEWSRKCKIHDRKFV